MKNPPLAILFLLFPIVLLSQSQQVPQQPQSQPEAPPSTDIFVAPLKLEGDTVVIGKPANVTARKGYDNQPRFLPDGESFFYTSIGGDGQADPYRYDLKAGKSIRIASTPESEYSPTLMPDGKNISVVRVEADGTQRLWKFPRDGGEPQLILESVKPVGYHAWVDPDTVVLFILGQPNTIQVASLKTEGTDLIAEKAGRCLQNVPGTSRISFTRHTEDQNWNIEEWDPQTRKTRILTTVISDDADYAWLADGSLLIASDSRLLRWNPAKGSGWIEVADLASLGLRGITRIAVSPRGDRIALVATE